MSAVRLTNRTFRACIQRWFCSAYQRALHSHMGTGHNRHQDSCHPEFARGATSSPTDIGAILQTNLSPHGLVLLLTSRHNRRLRVVGRRTCDACQERRTPAERHAQGPWPGARKQTFAVARQERQAVAVEQIRI